MVGLARWGALTWYQSRGPGFEPTRPRISAARFPLRLSCAETCCGLRRALEPAAGYAGLARRKGNDGLWIKAPTPPTITPGFYGRVG